MHNKYSIIINSASSYNLSTTILFYTLFTKTPSHTFSFGATFFSFSPKMLYDYKYIISCIKMFIIMWFVVSLN